MRHLKSLNILGLVLLSVAIATLFMEPSGCGDRPEDYRLVYNWGFLGSCLAGIYFLSSLKTSEFDYRINYILQFIIGYFVFYSISVFGLSQIRDIQMYLSHSTLHKEIADLKPMQFVWAFFGYSKGYKSLIGWTLLLGSTTLCFRNTRLLGSLIMTGILANIFALNYFFDVCLTLRSFIYLSMTTYLLACHFDRLWRFFFSNSDTTSVEYPIFKHSGMAYQSLNYFKLILIAGTLVFYGWKQDRMLRWTKNNKANPIEGTWNLVEMQADKTANLADELKLMHADMVIFERGVWGYVVEEDSMSMFKYLLDTSNQQFELYDFHNYRSLDLKGKYEFIDSETLLFEGKNNKDSLSILLKKNVKYDKPK